MSILPILMLALAAAQPSVRAPGGQPAPTTGAARVTAFIDVHVVPMDSERVLDHQNVVVRGDRIVAVGPTASTPIPAGATRIDGHGQWLMPGLVDMHVHFNDPTDAPLYVVNGVTTIRNMWGFPATLKLRREYAGGEQLGPTIYTTGAILDGKPPIWPSSTVIENAEQAETEITAEKAAGYDFVKVYSRLTPAAYAGILVAAKKHGMRVIGHVPDAVGLDAVLAARGQESIEHLTGYLGAVQTADSRYTSLTDWNEKRREAVSHIDDAKIPELARRTREAGTWNCMTLIVNRRFSVLNRRDSLLKLPSVKYVTPEMLAAWDPAADFRLASAKDSDFTAMRAACDFQMRMTRALHDAGARILLGTDTSNPFVIPGFAVHEELGLLVAAGLSPYEALRAATSDAADFLHAGPEFGRVRPGLRADLVLVAANPLADVRAAARRTGVMLRGVWLPAARLDSELDRIAAERAPRAAGSDWFQGMPALAADSSGVEWRATYEMSLGKTPVGSYRMAVVRRPDGGRTILAQSAQRPPGPKLATSRLELDREGHATSLALDEDGARHATARWVSSTRLELAGEDAGRPIAIEDTAAAGRAFDTLEPGVYLPICERLGRLAPGDSLEVASQLVMLSPGPGLVHGTYHVRRANQDPSFDFRFESPFMNMNGTFVLDADRRPVTMVLRTPFGKIEIRRTSAAP